MRYPQMTSIFNTVDWRILYVAAMGTYFIAELSAKKYALNPAYVFFWITFISYNFNTILFLPILSKVNNLATVGTLWNMGHAAVTLSVACLVFHEPLALKQWVGIGFGIIAVFLLM